MSTQEQSGATAAADTHSPDVVVVGAGTAGCYAAATIARADYEVVILERKSEDEAGHIACGDALKGASAFPEAIPREQIEPAFTNTGVDHGRFEIPQEDTVLEIPVPGELAVIDRWDYGKRIIEGAQDAGAEIHYDTVVQDVTQADDEKGTVTGVEATNKGERQTYEAEVVIDAAGSLSVLQDKVDFSNSTFDTNVDYSHFCSAYREIVTVEEPVPWDDALVFKPTERAAGYLWYFPRTDTEINAGLGFQMTEEPMQLVDDLKRDLEARPEFQNAEVDDKLGAALPTGGPTTLQFTRATSQSATQQVTSTQPRARHRRRGLRRQVRRRSHRRRYRRRRSEREGLWEYNEHVMDHFGARYAALDVYNILSTAVDVDDLMGLLAVMPGEKLAEASTPGVRVSAQNSPSRVSTRAMATGEPFSISIRPNAALTTCSSCTKPTPIIRPRSSTGKRAATS